MFYEGMILKGEMLEKYFYPYSRKLKITDNKMLESGDLIFKCLKNY